MKKKPAPQPLLISIIFALFSFFPVLHFIFLTYDGFILYVVNKLIFNDEAHHIAPANWIANFSLAVSFLALYYNSKSRAAENITAVLFLIFSFCFIYIQVSESLMQDMKPYFLLPMIVSLLSGSVLYIVLVLKRKWKTAAPGIIYK